MVRRTLKWLWASLPSGLTHGVGLAGGVMIAAAEAMEQSGENTQGESAWDGRDDAIHLSFLDDKGDLTARDTGMSAD